MRSFGVRLPILAVTAWASIGLSVSGMDSATPRPFTSPRRQQSRGRRLTSPLAPTWFPPPTLFRPMFRPLTLTSPSPSPRQRTSRPPTL